MLEFLSSGDTPEIKDVAVKALLTILAAVFVPPLFKLAKLLYEMKGPSQSSKNIPGPPNGHFLWGYLKETTETEPLVVEERWMREYGHVMRYKKFHGARIHLQYPARRTLF